MITKTPSDFGKVMNARLTELLGALLDDGGILEMRARLRRENCVITVVRAQRREILELGGTEFLFSDAEHQDAFAKGGVAVRDWFVEGSVSYRETQLLLTRRSLDKSIAIDVFDEEGAMPASVAAEALREARMGNGVCVIGPNAGHNQRVVSAFANALDAEYCVQRFEQGQSIQEIEVTTEVVAAARMQPHAFVDAATARPDVMWVVGLLCPSISAAERVPKLLDCAPHLLYFAAPHNAPVLIERHAVTSTHGQPPPPNSLPTRSKRKPDVARQATPLAAPLFDELPPIPDLGEAPPSDWAIDDAEHDIPAGELEEGKGQSVPVSDDNSGFLEVLNSVRERPLFKPSKPIEHPQAQSLKDKAGAETKKTKKEPDPFGGLTFEAPPRKEDL